MKRPEPSEPTQPSDGNAQNAPMSFKKVKTNFFEWKQGEEEGQESEENYSVENKRAKERERRRLISDSIEELRRVLPPSFLQQRKLNQVSTMSLAVEYIKSLQQRVAELEAAHGLEAQMHEQLFRKEHDSFGHHMPPHPHPPHPYQQAPMHPPMPPYHQPPPEPKPYQYSFTFHSAPSNAPPVDSRGPPMSYGSGMPHYGPPHDNMSGLSMGRNSGPQPPPPVPLPSGQSPGPMRPARRTALIGETSTYLGEEKFAPQSAPSHYQHPHQHLPHPGVGHRKDDMSGGMDKNLQDDGHHQHQHQHPHQEVHNDHQSDGMDKHRQESGDLAPATVVMNHQLSQQQDQSEHIQGDQASHGMMPATQKHARVEIVKFL